MANEAPPPPHAPPGVIAARQQASVFGVSGGKGKSRNAAGAEGGKASKHPNAWAPNGPPPDTEQQGTDPDGETTIEDNEDEIIGTQRIEKFFRCVGALMSLHLRSLVFNSLTDLVDLLAMHKVSI